MKIGIKRRLKRVVLSLFNMGFYDSKYNDIQPGDIYTLDTPDTRNPFVKSDDKQVQIIHVQYVKHVSEYYVRFRHLYDDQGQENMEKHAFLKKYFREEE